MIQPTSKKIIPGVEMDLTTGLQKSRELIRPLIILSGCLFIFYPSLFVGYVSDDYDLLYAASSPDFNLLDPFPAGGGSYFRPLVLFTLFLEHQIPIGSPVFIHHAVNLIVHASSGMLVYMICNLISHKKYLSLFLALFFVTHPANVTNIYWISGRTDSLSAVFFLVGLFGFLKYFSTTKLPWIGIMGIGYAGSILSKESAAVFVVVSYFLVMLLKIRGNDKLESPDIYIPPRRLNVVLISFLFITFIWEIYIYINYYSLSDFTLSGLDLKKSLELLAAAPLFFIFPNSRFFIVQIYRLYPQVILVVMILGIAILTIFLWKLLKRMKKEDLELIMVLGSLILVPLLPAILFNEDMSSRLLYLTIAMVCISISGLSRIKPLFVPWIMKMLIPILIVTTAFSLKQGELWVDNWQISQSQCERFRILMTDVSPEVDILFLTIADSIQNVPVFSNDINAALYYCLYGTFGYYDSFFWSSALIVESNEKGSDLIEISSPNSLGSWDIWTDNPDSYFKLPRGDRGGKIFMIENIFSREDGRVNRFTVTLTDLETVPEIYVFYSSGSSITRIERINSR